MLGDVIIADRLWEYDTGKLRVKVVEGERREHEQTDMEMYLLRPEWKRAAKRFKIDRGAAWLSLRPRSCQAQGDWILDRLHRGKDPRKDPERVRKCVDFDEALKRLWNKKLLQKGKLALTDKGRQYISKLLLLNLDELPEQEPFSTFVGPIASGSRVIEDKRIFARLAKPVRKVLGMEMEAAAIGALAYARRLDYSIVMKGVMDHADPDKSDNFKPFAARASTPDGRFAVSASEDKTLRVWNLKAGHAAATLEIHASVRCCAVTSDGKTILAGDATGVVHVLDWLNAQLHG